MFLAMVFVALVSIQRLNTTLRRQERDYQIIVEAGRLQHHLTRMGLAQRGQAMPFGLHSTFLQQDYRSSRGSFFKNVESLHEQLLDQPEQARRLKRIIELEAEWHPLVTEASRKLAIQPGQPSEGHAAAMDEFVQQTAPLTSAIQQLTDELITVEQERAEEVHAQIGRQTRLGVWLILLMTPLALTLNLLVAWRTARNITRPLNRLREAAGQLIAGHFQVLDAAGPSEIVELTTRFNHMGLTLAERTTSLQAQTERYQRYIGATSHILWSTDASGRVVNDIPTWCSYTGQCKDEVFGDGWFNAVHPEDRDAVRRRWEEVVRTRGIFEQEFRLRSATGEYRDFACRGVPILNADNTVREWLGTCTDVTERRRQVALQLAKDEAEAANRAKSEFLAKMSHELRTPLNAVIGMSRMLATQRFGPLNAKQKDYLQDIIHAGEHLLGLINDILDLTKVEAGRMELRTEPFQSGETIEAVVATVRPLADQRGVRLTFQPPESEDVLVTDLSRLRQILYNLLSNAIKFTPKRGRVTVTCNWKSEPSLDAAPAPAETANAASVSVSDTGPGIAPDDQEAIWSEFRPLKPSPEGFEGSGLGLALIRRLVHLLGGQIGLVSAINRGSTFTVVLPRRMKVADAGCGPPTPEPDLLASAPVLSDGA
jgi:PAS domain S-box-containing protein